jgi:hypothetical protein
VVGGWSVAPGLNGSRFRRDLVLASIVVDSPAASAWRKRVSQVLSQVSCLLLCRLVTIAPAEHPHGQAVCRFLSVAGASRRVLAMPKVVGSSPIICLTESPAQAEFLLHDIRRLPDGRQASSEAEREATSLGIHLRPPRHMGQTPRSEDGAPPTASRSTRALPGHCTRCSPPDAGSNGRRPRFSDRLRKRPRSATTQPRPDPGDTAAAERLRHRREWDEERARVP